MSIEGGNLFALLRSRFPDRSYPCQILSDGSVRSYGEVEAEAARLHAWLRAKGVEPGDRILVQAPKTPEILSLYLAVLATGAIYTPLNHDYTPAEVDYFRTDSEPRLFVQDARAAAAEARALAPLTTSVARRGDDLAALIYTSGTTGRSKGAALSHSNLASNGLALQRLWGFSPDDILLHALPIFHVHGLFVALHCTLLSGAAMIWQSRFEVAEVLAALPRATVMMGVPTFYSRLLADPRFARDAVGRMRLFISGSAPLLASTFEAFEERTGHRILERYGMSEAGMIASNPLDEERVPGSVGYALPGVTLRLSDRGMIEVKGPNVFTGYWRMPERTAAEFTSDDYFITGDLGRLDPDGRLWITGRARDLVISGGLNVYPQEIELVLDQQSGVRESAVIGVAHPDFGEAVVAIIEGEADEGELIAAARRSLAAFKVPKRVLTVGQLPRNAMGKVQKALLREKFSNLFAT